MKKIYDALDYLERIEALDKTYEENDSRYKDKYEWFLKKTMYEQFVHVQDYEMSNAFITYVYPKVAKRVRDNIMEKRYLTREGFRKLDKTKINWTLFCRCQRVAVDPNIIREYVDLLDWNAISTHHDFPITFLREFKDKLNWKIVTYWNEEWQSDSVFHKKEYKKEFGKYLQE